MADSNAQDAVRRRRVVRSVIVMAVLGVVTALILTVRGRLQGPTDPDEFLEVLTKRPETAALVAYTVRADGSADPTLPVLLHNADLPMPLAAVARIPILLAYAKAVAAGVLASDEPVLVSAWQRYYLPSADGGAHAKALRAYAVKVDQLGFAMEPKAEVKLDQVVEAMIVHNDYAAGDYLLARIGEQQVNAVVAEAGLTKHDVVLPFTGLFLLAGSAKDEDEARRICAQPPEAFARTVREAAAKFDREIAGTPAHKTWLRDVPPPSGEVQAVWSDQAMTKGTAGSYAALLARVAADVWGSAEERKVVQRHLGWPLALEENHKVFSAFGGKGGTLVSIITEATYLVPKQGDFQGRPRVVVLFQRHVPTMQWVGIVRSFVHQQFMLKVGLEREFAQRTQQALAPS